MMDLVAVNSLRAIDLYGSVVAAADALGFTPSAISQQVKRLERQTGVPLLERVGRGVMLTRQGRHLADAGGRVLSDLEALEADLRRQSGAVSGRMRLTAFSTAMRGMVAPRIATLRTAHPDLTLTLTESEPWETVDLVATGQTDVGVVHRWGDLPLAVPGHVAITPLTEDVADVIVHAGHPLAGRERVTPHDLLGEDWVATPDGTICRQWLTRMYHGTGQLPRITHQSMEFQSHLALVRAGLGIALVPRLGREPLGDTLVAVPAEDPVPTRSIVAVHRRSMAGSPAVQAVVTALALPQPERPGPGERTIGRVRQRA